MEEVIQNTSEASLNVSAPGIIQVSLQGDWLLSLKTPALASLLEDIRNVTPRINQLEVNTEQLGRWDTSLLIFLKQLFISVENDGVTIDRRGLPENVTGLLAMSAHSAANKHTLAAVQHPGILARLGNTVIDSTHEVKASIAFLGQLAMAFFRFLTGRARFQTSDLMLYIHECGVAALPIVALISIMIGAILAFVGAIQLEMFGAEIYVADLVAIGMAREMGALMTAMIIAGRTGSAFAAQLGTMQVNEEIDAYQTSGLPIIEFLVFPRAFALILMAPLLYLYAVVLGIFGGLLVAISVLDLGVLEYLLETQSSVGIPDFIAGMIKSVVFAFVVAYAGCMRGIQCGRSSSAVGQATTSAMVTAIVLIVISDTVLTIIYTLLDF